MGLVKTRRLAAMQKQQRARFGKVPPVKKSTCALLPHLYKSGGRAGTSLPHQFAIRTKISTMEPVGGKAAR